ncbi:MAG: tetratricopeptide repeat protein [Bacteroidota bacterium]
MKVPFRVLRLNALSTFTLLLTATILVSCKPEGFINKVKYRGESYVNDCESFTEKVNKLIESNTSPYKLQVSKYDNTDFDYYYLEPGQFEVKGDSLLFRLKDDLNYPTLLDKGVAVQVHVRYRAADMVRSLEKDTAGSVGTLVVDREYYIANRKPFFYYKVPLDGKEVAGKQILLSFSIAKYNNLGDLKKYYCQSEEKPFGIAEPACCTAKPFENTRLQSVIELPDLQLKAQKFVYGGFTATMDIIFPESEYTFADSLLAIGVQSYLEQFEGMGYQAKSVSIKGFASPGGVESRNIELADIRAKVIHDRLAELNADRQDLTLSYAGGGEDWLRVEELTQRSSLTSEEKDQVIAIVREDIPNDDKEAKLRLVPFWEQLVEEVLIRTRHTYIKVDFVYKGDEKVLERYSTALPIYSTDLKNVAKTEFVARPYAQGASNEDNLTTLEQILQKKASANLYALRATYAVADKNYDKAIADLEKAQELDPKNERVAAALQGYKILFADAASQEEKMKIYNEYSKVVQNNPGDRGLFFNRAVLMDKLGFISGALIEYNMLLEGNAATPANLNNQGVAMLKTNMFTEASQNFEKAIEADPNLGEAYFNLATIYAYRGLTSESVRYLDKAIAISPSYKKMILNNPIFSVVSEDPKYDKYRE